MVNAAATVISFKRAYGYFFAVLITRRIDAVRKSAVTMFRSNFEQPEFRRRFSAQISDRIRFVFIPEFKVRAIHSKAFYDTLLFD